MRTACCSFNEIRAVSWRQKKFPIIFFSSEVLSLFSSCPHLFPTQAHLPEIKVHAYFAPVTPPPSVHGGGQRLCRCCIILWQWRARGGHLCLQVLLLWYGLKWVGGGHQGRCRGEEGLDPLTAPGHRSIHRLIAADPWSVEPTPPLSSCLPISIAAAWVWAQRNGWKEPWWMDLCPLSVSFSLSHCKDKKRFATSFFPTHPWPPSCGCTGPHLDRRRCGGDGGGLNSGSTMHHVQTKKKNRRQNIKQNTTILLSWMAICSLWSIISTNHMTPLCDHPVSHSASTNKQQHGGRGVLVRGETQILWIVTAMLWHSQLKTLV